MNSPQAKLKRARAEEISAVDDMKKFKSDLLSKVIIKTIVKEQTVDNSVAALRFNHLPEADGTATDGVSTTSLGNLFATCGGDFATVYDDEHFGEHVAVVAQFKNEKTEHTAGGELTCVSWVDARGFTKHEFGDALLAVGGGDDHAVQIFSVAEAKVVRMLKGQGFKIVALAAGAADGNVTTGASRLAILDTNATVTVWDWRAATVICAFATGDAISLEMPNAGDVVYTGHADGTVVAWKVAEDKNSKKTISVGSVSGDKQSDTTALDYKSAKATSINLGTAHSASPVDCVRCLPGDRLVTKSVDGVVCVKKDITKSAEKESTAVTFKVPGCVAPKKKELKKSLTSFGCDPNGEFLASGNSDGETYVYDLQSGTVIKCVKQDRDFKSLNPVRAAAVSRDCRRVHAAFGPGVVWRAEVVPGLDDEEGPGTPEEA